VKSNEFIFLKIKIVDSSTLVSMTPVKLEYR